MGIDYKWIKGIKKGLETSDFSVGPKIRFRFFQEN